jgi:hypothetical protein
VIHHRFAPNFLKQYLRLSSDSLVALSKSNTTRPSPTSRSPPPPFSSVVDVSYEDENTFPSKFGDDPRVKTRGKRGSIQKLSLSQRQSEGYGVSRQPNGPPSGFDELGNRNFAKRNKERKSELLLKGLLRDCQNMEKVSDPWCSNEVLCINIVLTQKEMIVSMSPPRAQRGWSPTLPSPSPLPRIPPVPPYTKTSEPPEAWAAKHPFALGIWVRSFLGCCRPYLTVLQLHSNSLRGMGRNYRR